MQHSVRALAIAVCGLMLPFAFCGAAQAQSAANGASADTPTEEVVVDGVRIPVRVSECPLFSPQTVAGAGKSITGDGLTDYLRRLSHYLNDRLQRPVGGHQGLVCVHFIATRDGHVMLDQLATSSGYPELDREALALVQRAQPLPDVPSDLKGDTLNAVMPVYFAKAGDLHGPSMMDFGDLRNR